ncbi:hypothetical protein YC2023_033637 [Brassica napus]
MESMATETLGDGDKSRDSRALSAKTGEGGDEGSPWKKAPSVEPLPPSDPVDGVVSALQKGKEKEVLGGQVSSEEGSHGGGEVRFEVNANHSVVNELLLELQGLPSALGSDAGREMEWKGDGADGSVSSGSGKETVNGENVEWDLVEETSHQQFLRMISNP